MTNLLVAESSLPKTIESQVPSLREAQVQFTPPCNQEQPQSFTDQTLWSYLEASNSRRLRFLQDWDKI